MARITPIDVIKGISGKYGSGSNDYFATNTSSNKIRLAKLNNPYQGEATEKQQAVRDKFGARQAVATAWLNANKPSEANGEKGTEAYQYVQKLKRSYHFSNIIQVLYKHMDEDNVITLPESANDSTPAGGSATGGTSTTKYTLSLSASPAAGGTVTGAGQYNAGASALISAVAKTGYVFSKWSDGNTSASRTIVMDANKTLSAIFVTTAGGEVTPNPDEDGEVNNIH